MFELHEDILSCCPQTSLPVSGTVPGLSGGIYAFQKTAIQILCSQVTTQKPGPQGSEAYNLLAALFVDVSLRISSTAPLSFRTFSSFFEETRKVVLGCHESIALLASFNFLSTPVHQARLSTLENCGSPF
jgi:hypothetical protein